MFLWGNGYRKGLKFVHQLFQNMEYISEERAQRDFGLTQMNFNSIKAAMPKEWKDFFTTHPKLCYSPIPSHNYDWCITVENFQLTKKVYKFISDDIILCHNKYVSWTQELGQCLTPGLCEFGKEHLRIYKQSNVPKYRSFQYRILQRGLVTNKHLYYWGIKSSKDCTFCQNEAESISHMLCFCPEVLKLWDSIIEFYKNKYSIRNELIQFSGINVILNKLISDPNHIVNLICLITKQYIYRQRCLNKKLSCFEVQSIVKKTENIEKYIAIKNNRLGIHNKKWRIHVERVNQSNENFIRNYIEDLSI